MANVGLGGAAIDWTETPDPETASRAWSRVRVQDWTPESWAEFLLTLTPRQLIYQMRTWFVLGQDAPELRQEFEDACAQARDLLRLHECTAG